MMKKLLILLVTCATFFTACAQDELNVGDIFEGFALKSTKGDIFDLNANRKVKGYILVFMTPTCDHCINYEPRVVALNNKYKKFGYPVVAVGPYGDNPEKYPLDDLKSMKKLADGKHFEFPYVSDEEFKYTWLLGIKSTPSAVVLQKQGKGFKIAYRGRIDDEEDPKKTPKKKFVEDVVNGLLR